MSFLDALCEHAKHHPQVLAFRNSAGQTLTYGALEAQSQALANHIARLVARQTPLVLLGHKEPAMIVGMIACMKAGCPYVPLDTTLPAGRIEGIINQLGTCAVIEAQPGALERVGLKPALATQAQVTLLSAEEVGAIASEADTNADLIESHNLSPSTNTNADLTAPTPLAPVSGEEAMYILFTSGSTGTPKGVVQPARSLECTYRYFSRFIPSKPGPLVFFNRAHYSFDLSLFDFAIALPFGHTLFALCETEEASLKKTFEALHAANPSLWVSTPSFLEACLTDPAFNESLLPALESIVVCGETLHNSTALKCLDRFKRATLFNTYGPTEAQGAITDIVITPEVAEAPEALPVGYPSPYNQLYIEAPDGSFTQEPDLTGEVVIAGGTIATGYFGRPDLTAKSFGILNSLPFYRTGDEGYFDEQGLLHYLGRLDLQVKVNGFRIELEEIEATLNRAPEVFASCVVPVERNGIYTALAAHLILNTGVEPTRETSKQLKEALRESLPAYMIPRTYTYHEHFPSNANGKIDRKALAACGQVKRSRS
jgi:D-alanine--poly(phosphoribitol) ligase subunit 1